MDVRLFSKRSPPPIASTETYGDYCFKLTLPFTQGYAPGSIYIYIFENDDRANSFVRKAPKTSNRRTVSKYILRLTSIDLRTIRACLSSTTPSTTLQNPRHFGHTYFRNTCGEYPTTDGWARRAFTADIPPRKSTVAGPSIGGRKRTCSLGRSSSLTRALPIPIE